MELTFEQWWDNVGGGGNMEQYRNGGNMEQYRNVWNAAQNAMVERFTSTNRQSGPCSKFAECKSPIKDSCCKGLYICHK